MKLILQIDLSDWKTRPYQKPLLELAKGLAPAYVVTDLDQESDVFHLKAVKQLIDQAAEILLIVDAQPDIKLGASLEIFYALIKSKQKVKHVLVEGSNTYADKLLLVLKEKTLINYDNEVAEKIVRQFCDEQT